MNRFQAHSCGFHPERLFLRFSSPPDDSPASRISAVIVGSAETTFYVLALYIGAVNITRTRYLLPVCLIADAFGIAIAIIIVKLMF